MEALRLEVQQIILSFYRRKSDEELRELETGHDVERGLDEETLEEIKEYIWNRMKHNIHWYYLIDSIKDMLPAKDEDEDEENVEED